MTSLTTEIFETLAIQKLNITDDTLSVDLSDGRTISVPLAWYPRLLHPTFRTFQSTFEQFYNPYSVRVSTIFVF